MKNHSFEFEGLPDEEVKNSRAKYGYNTISGDHSNELLDLIKDVITEPMVILLLVACIIYFSIGEVTEGIMMIIAISFVTGISVFQEIRSKNALKSLKSYIDPRAKVIRNNELQSILAEYLVVDDIILVEEGNLIPADAEILQSNDFYVNESILTGESFPVEKNPTNSQVYFGTLVTSGYAVARISKIGNSTELGKIGKSIDNISTEKTPLQQQINRFVKLMAGIGLVFFILVWLINYLNSKDILHGLLHGLTLAMSILPEEIPVAFATFMALGARQLIRQGVLTRQPVTVESLGSASVICVDKTGTITENKMKVEKIFDFHDDKMLTIEEVGSPTSQKVLAYSMWASETSPFDPMELAIHDAYKNQVKNDLRSEFSMIHEYPLDGTPPMMTHIYSNQQGEKIIAAKGGWESIAECSHLSATEKNKIKEITSGFASSGLRVLGVSAATFSGENFPDNQRDFNWEFLGLIALEDPPKENIKEVVKAFYDAGIEMKLVTGDYPETALSIAGKIGLKDANKYVSGQQVMEFDSDALQSNLDKYTVFARMFPDAKLKLIEALKEKGEIVAMTGDGVNDAPALKASHIGVAMGKKGTETAKRAASLILANDNLTNMVYAVSVGRRIYTNLKKAIQYIISIHIPIMLTVSLPLLFDWKFTNIFNPIHVIFFELIMGPTCSIAFENEPMEKNQMLLRPRKMTRTFFSFKELFLSIIQGLAITAGALFLYFDGIKNNLSEETIRTIVFTTIIFSNIFLTLVNRSFYYSVVATLKYKNNLIPIIILITLGILVFSLTIPQLRSLFEFSYMTSMQIVTCLGASFLSVIWLEFYKWNQRRKHQ